MPHVQKSILLVEDELAVAMLEKEQLENAGYQIIHAETGKQAIQIVYNGKLPVDLILMDIELGNGMDGAETAREILTLFDIPIVFLTSHTDQAIAEKTCKIPSYWYVVKGSGFNVIYASIDMAFQLYATRYKNSSLLNKYKLICRSLSGDILHGFAFCKMLYRGAKPSDFVFLFVNRALEIMLKYERIEGRKATELAPNIRENDPELFAVFGRVSGTGKPECLELYLKTFKKWYSVSASSPRRGHFTAILTDIDECRRAESALRESESMMRLLIDMLPTGLAINEAVFADHEDAADYRVLEANRTFRSYFTAPETRNSGLRAAFPETVRTLLKEVKKSNKPSYTEQYDPSSQRSYSVAATPLSDNKFVTAITDITDQKNLVLKLKDNLHQLNSVQNSAKIGFWKLRLKDMRLEWSDGLKMIFDLPPHGRTPNFSEFWKFVHPDDLQFVEEMADYQLKPMQTSCVTYIYRIKTGEGRVKYLEHTGKQLLTGDNDLIEIFGLVQDITERKVAEEKIANLLQEKEMLLREVHHRIKNNLNSISMLLEVQAGKLDNRPVSDIFEDAIHRLRSMSMLYDKLYRSENMTLLFADEYLPNLIQEIIKTFPNMETVRLVTRFERIQLDFSKLYPLGIIINELVTNSMKYAFQFRDSGTISVSLTCHNKRLCLVFEDDGIGLPETVSIEKPTSFGMKLIWLYARQINGTARVESEKRSRFLIEFDA